MERNNINEARAKGIYFGDIIEVKSKGLSYVWMRERRNCPRGKVDSLGDCIMVLPFIERGDVVIFSLRKIVRLILKDYIIDMLRTQR